jgi:hypothetical protein
MSAQWGSFYLLIYLHRGGGEEPITWLRHRTALDDLLLLTSAIPGIGPVREKIKLCLSQIL